MPIAIKSSFQFALAVALTAFTTPVFADPSPPNTVSFTDDRFVGMCASDALQELADATASGITIREVGNITPGLDLPGGARYFPETDKLPAYCQVSGSFVTNPETGKTANFLATLPQSWNGKYLQYGCFSHCGFFLFNDASHPMVNLVAQGKPGDSLRKGYASFATDEGHTSRELAEWTVNEEGEPDREALDDFYYRATRELAATAKRFTARFYSRLAGESQTISRSYFTGCSGGGRDGLVAASYFPEAFDGIVVGSPYADMVAVNAHRVAQEMALRRPGGGISPELVGIINETVLAGCDKLDGVEDGIIQNPAACDFDPARDLPRCREGEGTAACFTGQQIESVSTLLTALTDRQGNVIQPGMSVSELQVTSPDGDKPLDNEVLRYFAFPGDGDFSVDSLVRLDAGGKGEITAFRGTVSPKKMKQAREAVRSGTGNIPENAGEFIRQDRKMLIWHNLGDERLTPYISFNYYNQLAGLYGGYEKLQENIRLFGLPATGHCGMSGAGPTSFDALSAIEAWVEEGWAPNALVASKFPDGDFSKDPVHTMPLCKYPEMARYKGEGAINDAANWYCPEGDKSMLDIGSSGKQAGLLIR